MTEKHRETVEPSPGIETHATQISVANGRAVEPFVKTFSFSSENVTQESLGTLIGAFSVSDRSESSAYTVNLIASVAKKEYYANPRRDTIESFESTLHRINITLSELVKHGRSSWMGNLHGAIAVVSGDALHLSVTGNGTAILFRDKEAMPISDGLASEEASSHPLKTFLEISSGRLLPNDCILLSTPEPMSIFSPSELERNANRLIPDRKFMRFLDTAMRNELKIGAVVAIDVRESAEKRKSAPAKKQEHGRDNEKETVIRPWSSDPFEKVRKERTEAVEEPHDPEKDIESGLPDGAGTPKDEIRIPGGEIGYPDENRIRTRIWWMLEDAIRSFRDGLGQFSRDAKLRREALTNAASVMMSKASDSVAEARFHFEEERKTGKNAKKESPRNMAAPAADTAKETGPTDSVGTVIRNRKTEVLASAVEWTGTFIKSSVVPATLKGFRIATRFAGAAARRSRTWSLPVWSRFRALPKNSRIAVVSATVILLLTASLLAAGKTDKNSIRNPEPLAATIPPPETPAKKPFPPTEEKNAGIARVSAITVKEHDIVTPVFLGESLFITTKTGIIDVTKGKTFGIPGSDTVRLAAGMADIGTVLLLTEGNTLYSFTPSNGSFSENAITFPEGFRPVSMGDFLTYAYFLGDGTGNVLRYPRDTGGFSEGSVWTKTALPGGTASIAVDGNLYASDGDSVLGFSNGVPIGSFSDRKPVTTRTITALCANSDIEDRFVILDADAMRIMLMNGDGTIDSQLFHESFAGMTSCALSGDGKSVALSGEGTALAIRISD
jgi:hypothetical protein